MGDYADIPYVQARSFGAARETTQVVVIHATDNTATAAGEASYAARRTDQVSAHFFVDEQQCIQSVPLSAVAFGCLWHGNHRSVQFELCGRSNQITDATMRRAAPYVRRICDRYAIPLRKVSAADVRAGVKGICGHGDITAAFPEDHGDHTDPGSAFPWATFIGYVVAGTGEQGDDMAGETADWAASHVPVPGSPGQVQGSHLALGQILDELAELKARPPATVDAAALATALVAHPDFITALAGAVAVRTVDEEARRLGDG